MAYRNVVVEAGGAIVTVTVNRPKVLNALNMATMEELRTAVDEQDRSRGGSIIISCAGFCG